MQAVVNIQDVQKQIQQWKLAGERVAFVPTMGNLHAGHLRLVQQAQQDYDRIVVSIFVNPTQFGPNEDFASYPRTLDADQRQLQAQKVDLLFLPAVDTMYPKGALTSVQVAQLSELHCGASRPGHFSGVATVVTKLFNIVQPECAYFGEKDFQQLSIIRQMVRDLNIPVSIASVPTVREKDGLAMSSRNGYLTVEQRAIAPRLYQALCAAKLEIEAGMTDYASIQQKQLSNLQQAGFIPDYFLICNQHSLHLAGAEDTELVILAAAKLGKPRLIDNISFQLAS